MDLADLVAQVVYDAQFEAGQRGVEVMLESDGRCAITGNAELLSSAIENVVRNAVHYTDPGTTVQVVLHGEEGNHPSRIVLSVRDSGPGVPAAELASILLPFYRTAEARDRRSGGAGLGLAIADRVVRTHGGAILASNRAPHGLEVRITLPRAEGVSGE